MRLAVFAIALGLGLFVGVGAQAQKYDPTTGQQIVQCPGCPGGSGTPSTVISQPTAGAGGYSGTTVGVTSSTATITTPTVFLDIVNASASATVAFCFGACTAVINGQGSITLPPNWHRSWEGTFVPTDAVHWIASAASTPVTVGTK